MVFATASVEFRNHVDGSESWTPAHVVVVETPSSLCEYTYNQYPRCLTQHHRHCIRGLIVATILISVVHGSH